MLVGLALLIAARVPRAEAVDAEAAPIRFLLQWGKQGSEPGDFHFPIGIAINQADEVFVTDHYNNHVQKFDTDGKYLSGFGEEQGSQPGQFFAPHGLAMDSRGHLYVVDAYNHRIQKFSVTP